MSLANDCLIINKSIHLLCSLFSRFIIHPVRFLGRRKGGAGQSTAVSHTGSRPKTVAISKSHRFTFFTSPFMEE